jgi:ribosomal protein S25
LVKKSEIGHEVKRNLSERQNLARGKKKDQEKRKKEKKRYREDVRNNKSEMKKGGVYKMKSVENREMCVKYAISMSAATEIKSFI